MPHHVQVVLVYGTVYMVFLWIYGSVTDDWRYGLDWRRTRAVGAYIILPITAFIFFVVW